MTRRDDKIKKGTLLVVVGFFGLVVYSILFTPVNSYMYPGIMGGMMPMSMMGRRVQGTLTEINGKVEKVGWMEIELEVDGKEVEVHGASGFWQKIGIKEGDAITVKGVFISMMEMEGGWHEELIPFELTLNGVTYGNAGGATPIWMQGT